MSAFLIVMIVGLIGMVLMAIPGLNRHGHGGLAGHGHAIGHAGQGVGHAGHAAHGGQLAGPVRLGGARAGRVGKEAGSGEGLLTRLVPNPRVIFSLLTAYGAFGYAMVGAAHLAPLLAALLAVVPAVLLERYALEPFWQAMLQFQGTPSAPLTEMVMCEAVAVTPFRNGKGVVSVVREGRDVQFSAHLLESQATMPVQVGDRLRVEEVDDAHERVVVSLH
jgi:hypothetical protein